jgi:hypothetical protein
MHRHVKEMFCRSLRSFLRSWLVPTLDLALTSQPVCSVTRPSGQGGCKNRREPVRPSPEGGYTWCRSAMGPRSSAQTRSGLRPVQAAWYVAAAIAANA